jgi:putative CocE/NonD family hydrolase
MSPRQSATTDTVPEARPVRVVDNEWIELPDRVRLAIRLWLPEDADRRPVSAILDSVPYRKSDGTAVGDAEWGTYFAAHGFAYARVDLRGSGDSSGILEDEYTDDEQRDSERVIAWLAERPWCTGAVGMIGMSWGGFAALQMAAGGIDQLRGVIAIHASDDRYADDVHYIGGCVSAMDMTPWATSMLAYLNQPPDPRVVGEGWREAWLERLRDAKPFIEPWLTHQRRDAYWQQGSACETFDAIRCPVFAVGGWSDGYRDMVFRVVEHVRGPVRGLIGPWGHTSPERGAPGPAIGFLQECVRFFAASLDSHDNGFFEEPRLISYMQEPVTPAGSYAHRPGRWVADPVWPSPAVDSWTFAVGAGSLQESTVGEPGEAAVSRSIRSLQATGVDGGVWCGDGGPADFAVDQRSDDGASLCWDSAPLAERVELLGRCEAQLELRLDRSWALVAVRVCDVAPDGSSTLVARGLLNLSRRSGNDRSDPMPLNEPVVVRVLLQSTAYAIPAGHRIRLAVSNAYWPMVWPSPEPGTMTVVCGPRSFLSLPRRRPSELDTDLRPFGPPESGTPLASEKKLLRDRGRRVRRDLSTGEVEVRFEWQGWRTRIIATDTEMGEENITTYRIVEGDPLSATVITNADVSLSRPGWNVRTVAASTMTCELERFIVTTTLDAFHDNVRVHACSWTHQFPRDGA